MAEKFEDQNKFRGVAACCKSQQRKREEGLRVGAQQHHQQDGWVA